MNSLIPEVTLMETIVIHVRDKEKARLLKQLLSALDFVDSFAEVESSADAAAKDELFFGLTGIWEGRNITVEEIRRQAWPRQAQ